MHGGEGNEPHEVSGEVTVMANGMWVNEYIKNEDMGVGGFREVFACMYGKGVSKEDGYEEMG